MFAPRKSSLRSSAIASASSIGRAVPQLVASRRCPGGRRPPAASPPESEWATGWPMRTTRFVMHAPLRVRGRSRGTRSPPTRVGATIGLALGDEAGDGEGHREPVIVQCLGDGAAQGAAAVGSRCRRPRRARPRRAPRARPRSRRSRSDSLCRSSPAPRIRVVPAAAAAARREDRDLVDRRRHLGGRRGRCPGARSTGPRGPRGARRPRRRAPAGRAPRCRRPCAAGCR